MNYFKKIIKIIVLLTIVFLALTVILTVIISFTSFKEEWIKIGLIVIVTAICLMAGYLVGTLFNSKGLIVGFVTSFIVLELLVLGVQLLFLSKINNVFPDILYLISILFGTMGGVIGVNSKK